MKAYRSGKYDACCAAYTTRELEEFFDRRLGGGREKESLLGLFEFGDQVKFGGGRASREKRMQDAALAAEAAASLERRGRGEHADL